MIAELQETMTMMIEVVVNQYCAVLHNQREQNHRFVSCCLTLLTSTEPSFHLVNKAGWCVLISWLFQFLTPSLSVMLATPLIANAEV